MDVIAPEHRATAVWRELLGQVQSLAQARGAHPSRTFVLLPFAQLMPLARRSWAALQADGFAPRFETSMNWAARLAGLPGPEDLSFERGRDLLVARTWLDRAGLGARGAVLAGRLVDAAWQAAQAAAAVPPPQRAAWADSARASLSAGLEHPSFALEAAVARIALEWAAASCYATDVLLREETLAGIELLVLVEGLQPDAVGRTLVRLLGPRALRYPIGPPAQVGQLRLHQAPDPEQEAEMAAACVVRQLAAGRAPVALPAIDRVLTRRVRAMLEQRGIAVRDETGWKLSTTRAGARVMALLRAAARDASTDAVLDWLKHVPAVAPGTVQALERRVRRAGLRDWLDVRPSPAQAPAAGWSALVEQTNAWRARLHGPRPLAAWLEGLRGLLEEAGALRLLAEDAAGSQLLQALGLADASPQDWLQGEPAARRLSPGEFTAWVNDVLEAASFVPLAPGEPQVVVLPFHQLLARPFPALVLAGCDEVRLPAVPEPPGDWTAAQRAALGLPSREALEQERRAAWRHALALPGVDLLWRCTDDSGEPVLASPLVLALRLASHAALAADPREPRTLAPAPVQRPLPQGTQLPVEVLSASAYEDLRKCPYRFFALRQLGLQEAAELEAEVDKRDFGNWLHQVLRLFHERLREDAAADRKALLEACAADATRSLGLPEGEFLPFAAAWPQARDGYLAWLAEHEAGGARFDSAETEHEVRLGTLRLKGRIDRIDRLPDGRRMVVDYKTEGLGTTRDRVQLPTEDTQLAFYAALLEDDRLAAAYVNVGERGETITVEQPCVVQARDALLQGIRQDLERVAGGAHLPALGEGSACEYCAARGVCRRDFWHD